MEFVVLGDDGTYFSVINGVRELIEVASEVYGYREDVDGGDEVLSLQVPGEFTVRVFHNGDVAFEGYGKRFLAPVDELAEWWHVIESLEGEDGQRLA